LFTKRVCLIIPRPAAKFAATALTKCRASDSWKCTHCQSI